MSDILTETQNAFAKAITENLVEIDRKLSGFGLSISDIPHKCSVVHNSVYAPVATYYLDDVPILETKLILDGEKIIAEVNVL